MIKKSLVIILVIAMIFMAGCTDKKGSGDIKSGDIKTEGTTKENTAPTTGKPEDRTLSKEDGEMYDLVNKIDESGPDVPDFSLKMTWKIDSTITDDDGTESQVMIYEYTKHGDDIKMVNSIEGESDSAEITHYIPSKGKAYSYSLPPEFGDSFIITAKNLKALNPLYNPKGIKKKIEDSDEARVEEILGRKVIYFKKNSAMGTKEIWYDPELKMVLKDVNVIKTDDTSFTVVNEVTEIETGGDYSADVAVPTNVEFYD